MGHLLYRVCKQTIYVNLQITPNINLPTSAQAAHKVSFTLFFKWYEQSCPADENKH